MGVHLLVWKLGMVRAATSLLVVLLANVLNRVLIVDLKVAASLVTFCFAFQHVATPVGLLTGYLSDAYALRGRHRAPYVWGGMFLALAVMPFFPGWAQALGAAPQDRGLMWQGILLFSLFGIGTTTSATAVNALLVDRLPETDRGPALTLVWILTLAGFIAGSLFISFIFPDYEPQGLDRLFLIVAAVVLAGTLWGTWGVEPAGDPSRPPGEDQWSLRQTLSFLFGNPQPLTFFAFLFASLFFLSLHTFLLTAYGGEVLSLPVAATSRFGVFISYGVILGMAALHLLLSAKRRGGRLVLALSLVVGAAAFGLLSLTSFWAYAPGGFVALGIFGFSRGLYNVGLSHLTMAMAHPAFSGIFMGLWNLVSGLALAAGEMTGGVLKDFFYHLSGDYRGAYGWLFLVEGLGLLGCLALLAPLRLEPYRQRFALLHGKKVNLAAAAPVPERRASSHESR